MAQYLYTKFMSLLPSPITISFFDRPVLKVAKDLIGCFLVRKYRNKITKYLITETEAYDGVHDLACHAAKGRTKRTEIMYKSAGHWYVYLIYGFHNMLNIVTGPQDYPAAVLIRGVENINGPGRLTKKLKINRKLNGKLSSVKNGLWIEGREGKLKGKIITKPRIGVDYAGPIWSKKEWRFILENK